MASRAEITTRFAKAYARAGKKDKGLVLDQVVAVTGWSRDNARRRLTAAAERSPGAGRPVTARPRKPRADKSSNDDLAGPAAPRIGIPGYGRGHRHRSPAGR